jgi:plastocyanin
MAWRAPASRGPALTSAPHRAPITVTLRGQRFVPARIVATPDDTIRFVLESGEPHNVAFHPDSILAGALEPLARNLKSDPRNLFTPDMLIIRGESVLLPLVGLPPGRYHFYCAPHYGGGMHGELIIEATAR